MQKDIQNYYKVIGGKIDLKSLSWKETECKMIIVNILSKSDVPKASDECKDAWDQANSAADDVASAAKRLIRCVEGSDHNDDCYSEARRVRSYHQDYESAVSEVQSYCD